MSYLMRRKPDQASNATSGPAVNEARPASWRKWQPPRPALIIALAALALSVLYLALPQSTYRSHTDLVVYGPSDQAQPRMLVSSEGLQPRMPSNASATATATSITATSTVSLARGVIETQMNVLVSSLITDRVFQANHLIDDPFYNRLPLLQRALTYLGADHSAYKSADNGISADRVNRANTPGRLPQTQARIQHEQALSRFNRTIDVRQLGRSNVIRLSVTADDPGKAATLAEAIAATYIQAQSAATARQRARRNAARNRQLKQMRQLQQKAAQASRRVRDFERTLKRQRGDGGPGQPQVPDEQAPDKQALNKLAAALTNARKSAALSAAYSADINVVLRRGGPAAIPPHIRSPNLQTLRKSYAATIARHAALSARLLPRHPLIMQIRRRQAALRAQLQSELRRIAAATRRQQRRANARIAQLSGQLARARQTAARRAASHQSAAQNQTPRAQLAQLQAAANVARRAVQQAGQQALGALALTRPERKAPLLSTMLPMRVITAASYPIAPVRSFGGTTSMLVLLAGTGLAIAATSIAWLVSHFSRLAPHASGQPRTNAAASNIDRSSPTKHASGNAPAKSIIPQNRNSEAAALPAQSTPRPMKHNFSDVLAAISAAPADAADQSAARFREDILALAARLHDPHTDDGQIILMHAARPDDGTSMLALALSVAAAQQGRQVLLVDADCSDLELSRVFAGSQLTLQSGQRDTARRGAAQSDMVKDLMSRPGDFLVEDSETGLHLLPFAGVATQAAPATPRSDAPQSNAAIDAATSLRPQIQLPLQGVRTLAKDYALTIINGGAMAKDQSGRDLINLADQVLVCERPDHLARATTRYPAAATTAAGIATDSATDSARDGHTAPAWQILSLKRRHGDPIIANIREPI